MYPSSDRQRYYNLQIPPEQRLEVRELLLRRPRVDQLKASLPFFSNLRVLIVEDAQLTHFPEEILNLPLLEELSLKDNQITLIPEQICRLGQLKKLNLAGNKLGKWPEILLDLPHLQHLDLSGNGLAEMPKDIKELKELRELHLADNQIAILPREMGHLQKIKHLELSGNQLKRLPQSIGNCVQLEICRLANNRLTVLPESLGNWANLNILDVRENRLKFLPKNLKNCLALQRLLAGKNRCKSIPDFIDTFQWLKVVDFSHNLLEKIGKTLPNSTTLDQLDLSNNRLTQLPDLSRMEQLERLQLAGNKLDQINALPPRLKYLDLSRNRLNHWPDSLLKGSRLRSIDMQYNRITQLPESFGLLTPCLEKLQLKNNPVKCTAEDLLPLQELQMISGLMPIKAFEKLTQFRSAAKSLALPQGQYGNFFQLFQGKQKELLATFDPKIWQDALNFYEGPIHDLCREYLLKRFGKPIAKKGIQQLCLAGRTAFDLQDLSMRLQQQGIAFSTEIQANTTHLLLGFPLPKKKAFTFPIPAHKVVFIHEKQLNEFLNQQEKRYLWLQAQGEQLEALKKLLQHPEAANVRLAVQMLKGGGVPKDLQENLFAAYLKRTEPDLKADLKTLLAVDLKDKGKRIIIEDQFRKEAFVQGKLSPDQRAFLKRNGLDAEQIKDILAFV